MFLKLLGKELRALRGQMIWWGLGIAAWSLVLALLFPSFSEQFKGIKLPDFYKVFGDFGDFSTLNGFLQAELYSFLLPLAVAVFAIMAGSRALGGEEDGGTLEVLMALPLSRQQLVLAKAASVAIALVVVVLLHLVGLLVGFAAIAPQISDTINYGAFIGASLASIPLLWMVGMLALWLGAYLPSSKQALFGSGLVVLAGYLVNNLGGMSDVVKNLQPFTPFKYFDAGTILRSGVDWGDVLVLLAATVVFLGLALLSFQRRNVTVGAWPWVRAKTDHAA